MTSRLPTFRHRPAAARPTVGGPVAVPSAVARSVAARSLAARSVMMGSLVIGSVCGAVLGAGSPADAAGDSLAVAQGSGQYTNIGTTFATQLGVTVDGAGGDSGTVTFTAPSGGASGTFSGPYAADGGT